MQIIVYLKNDKQPKPQTPDQLGSSPKKKLHF